MKIIGYGSEAKFNAVGGDSQTKWKMSPKSGSGQNNIPDDLFNGEVTGTSLTVPAIGKDEKNPISAGEYTISADKDGSWSGDDQGSMTLVIVRVDIDVDTDRNGTVENEVDNNGDGIIDDWKDDEKEDEWSKERGAVTYAGDYPEQTRGYGEYNNKDPNIPRVILRQIPSSQVPPDALIYIHCPDSKKILLYKNGEEYPVTFTSGGNYRIETDELTSGDIEFHVLAKGPRTKQWKEFTIEVQFKDKDNLLLHSDVVKKRVAPVILAWNGLEKVKQYGPVTNVWMQDIMELAHSQIQQKNDKYGHILVDLGYGDPAQRNYIYNNIISGEKFWQVSVKNNSGDGGDIEVTAPSKEHKFGMIYHGNKGGLGGILEQFILSQDIQVPAITLSTKWLPVGHADEVISFIRDTRLMVPSPVKAFDILQQEYIKGNVNEERA